MSLYVEKGMKSFLSLLEKEKQIAVDNTLQRRRLFSARLSHLTAPVEVTERLVVVAAAAAAEVRRSLTASVRIRRQSP